jgi:hypothetical protein
MLWLTKFRPLSGSLLLFLTISLRPATLQAWSPCCNWALLDLIHVATVRQEFDQRQNEFRLAREQERRNVPTYNLCLSDAVLGFHKHILKDEHYLVTNCGICRKYLKDIKSYSKKLDRAMR